MLTPDEEMAFLERDIRFREQCVDRLRWIHENGISLISPPLRSQLFFEMQTIIEQLVRLKAVREEKGRKQSRSLQG